MASPNLRGRFIVGAVSYIESAHTHAFTGVMRVVPGFRHHHRIVEIATGFSQPAKIVDSQPLTTGRPHLEAVGVLLPLGRGGSSTASDRTWVPILRSPRDDGLCLREYRA
ncbi:hypothetical protein A4X20_06090 [Mycolicibacterium iranicum]|uniref:Uncharacterized protein n=1 Tax=Mycolicibacterium iranicum TaxID=912594 RepID=A0A178LU20_MYCIR|nr:hypothetical protein A4X20_06090 [Mycolicibacterium iranicum]